MKNTYLDRYAYPKQLISQKPAENLELIVTIPCYNEQSLVPCLESLYACELPGDISIEVVTIVNESTETSPEISERNQTCYEEALNWVNKNQHPNLSFYVFHEQLAKKHAGVGLARKIAMDEAARRFESIAKPEGIILCYDADCSCDSNYLTEVYHYFNAHPKCPGASIHFEHPLEGDEDESIYKAIVDYELFLRYYVNALRYAGFPHAYETIGSSMAVRANAYQKQGGMNKRKAGEDFYFLHKIIPLGNFGEISSTKVIPSPRQSDRVPFGTGKAVNDWLSTASLNTYALSTFEDLRQLVKGADLFYQADKERVNTILKMMPRSVIAFFEEINGLEEIERVNNNVASLNAFQNQFFRWFDGFKVLKFVHFARDNFYPNAPVYEVAHELISKIYSPVENGISAKQLLKIYRELDSITSYSSSRISNIP